MAERSDDQSDIEQRDTSTKSTTPPMEGAIGTSDATNGGGAGAGIPDGDLAARAGDTVTRGDVHQDREKMFPEAEGSRPPGADVDDEELDER